MRVVESVAAARRFFHWPLEFADVFYDDAGRPKADPGFDAVIGNPPWEVLRKDNAAAGGEHTRDDTAEVVRFVRGSGLYPSCASGHVNLYQPFLDRALSITRRSGRIGLILPWGLAADDGAAALRRRLIDRARVHTVVGFDNGKRAVPGPSRRPVSWCSSPVRPARPARDPRAFRRPHERRDSITCPHSMTRSTASAFPVRLTADLLRRGGRQRSADSGRSQRRRSSDSSSGPATRFPAARERRRLGGTVRPRAERNGRSRGVRESRVFP